MTTRSAANAAAADVTAAHVAAAHVAAVARRWPWTPDPRSCERGHDEHPPRSCERGYDAVPAAAEVAAVAGRWPGVKPAECPRSCERGHIYSLRPRSCERGCSSPAFTLIEVVIVIFMMAALAGIAAISFAGFESDRSVSEPGNELIRLAKTAVRAAAIQGRPFVISFGEKEFGLVGLQEGAGGSVRVVLPDDTKLSILRWGQKNWLPAEGQSWMFGANGLCDPIRVRLESEEAVLEMSFNPLTGSPTEKQLALK